MPEVANNRALRLFRTEESNRGLGRNGSRTNGFCRRYNDKAVSLGFPGKVDDGVLDGVDYLYGYTLLLYAEDLEGSSLGLLGLGMPIDLDSKVRGVGLPM